jgi:hypothetical protein
VVGWGETKEGLKYWEVSIVRRHCPGGALFCAQENSNCSRLPARPPPASPSHSSLHCQHITAQHSMLALHQPTHTAMTWPGSVLHWQAGCTSWLVVPTQLLARCCCGCCCLCGCAQVRNSWGTYWGELGFFKVQRGVNALQIESGDCW